ncbi:hypothetical protein CZ809_03554 [Photobacterium piscicola]|uniref:Uncharacterized protein n=1 Tax=Photobacterium piscicola TaxID=1378299 RepID=A0A1T5I4B3_9GAMM|nr:hypothetical protein CZ809_03554 [Photobacterium piscicola]
MPAFFIVIFNPVIATPYTSLHFNFICAFFAITQRKN